MKKILLSVAILTTTFIIKAQIVNIPDANFKAYLVGNASINTNSDTEIQVSEAAAYTGLVNCQSMSIADLTGIEAFTSMTALYCDQNQLTTLDLSYNTALLVVQAWGNQLTILDVSNSSALYDLSCGYNNLTSLDISNNLNLLTLYCNNNNLTILDVSNNTALTNFSCAENDITSIDLSNIPGLTQAYCHNNQLTSLNVANGNNTNFTGCSASGNTNLICIQVDDANYSTTNWVSGNFSFDVAVTFSEDCTGATTSINPTTDANKFSVYPNPVKDIINFSVETNVKLSTATGQLVATANNINTLDISSQPSGIYFLHLQATTDKLCNEVKSLKNKLWK